MFYALNVDKLVVKLFLFQLNFASLYVFLSFLHEQVLFFSHVCLHCFVNRPFRLLLLVKSEGIFLNSKIELLQILKWKILTVIYSFG